MKKITCLFTLVFVSLLFGQVKIDSDTMIKELRDFKQRLNANATSQAGDRDYLNKLIKAADLGFGKVPHVKKAKQYADLKADIEKTRSYMNDYAAKYPDNPFITKGEIERIAKKYSLLFGNVNDFIDNIPEKNLNQILDFHEVIRAADFSEWQVLNYFVMAPARMFDLENKRVVDGIYIIDKDPVVFARVNGGYLLVTFWGEDAIEPMKEIEDWIGQVDGLYEAEEISWMSGWIDIGFSSNNITWSEGTIIAIYDTLWTDIELDSTDVSQDMLDYTTVSYPIVNDTTIIDIKWE